MTGNQKSKPNANNVRLHVIAWVVMLYTAAPGSVEAVDAQTVQRIDSRITCRACVIELEEIATISDQDTSAHFGSLMMLTRDARGHIYGVDGMVQPWLIRVYDRSGKVMRTVGASGGGAGEFRMASPPIFGPGDSMFVFDHALLRLSKYSPTHAFVESRILPHRVRQWLVDRHGHVIVNADVRSRERAGFPIHVIDFNGDIVQSFGTTQPELDPAFPMKTWRRLALAPSGDLWSAQYNSYVLERWGEDGALKATLVRVTDWFESWTRYEGPASVVKPPATIEAIWEDTERRLWVAVTVADASWRRTNMQAKAGDMIPMPRSANHTIYDTIIEVLDPRTGNLLVSKRLPHHLQSIGNGQPFVSYHENGSGEAYYKLWQFTLKTER